MKIIKVNKKEISASAIEEIADALLCEKVVAMLTDTVYGLHCLAESEKALEKVRKIKGRPKNMPFIILIKSYCMLHDYFKISKKQEEYIRGIWPKTTREAHDFSLEKSYKPTTFVLNSKSLMGGEKEGVAVRMPYDELLIKVLKKVNKPIISTSLNISGKHTLDRAVGIETEFRVLPDLVVDSGVCKKRRASAIVDVRDTGNIIKIR